MDNFLKNKDIAIIGYAETKIVRQSDLTGVEYAGEILTQLLDQTGIDFNTIDGVACNLGSTMRFWPNFLVENLGIQSRWTQTTDVGGAGYLANIHRAASAVYTGQANMVFCVGTPPYGPPRSIFDIAREFDQSAGYQGPISGFAFLYRAYDEKYGLNYEALGRLAVGQRESALKNPYAVDNLQKPITVDDYLNSRVVADPVRLLDIVMSCKGAYGALVTTTETAKQLGLKKMVHPVAYSEMINFNPHDPLPDVTETGFGVAGPEALEKAGMKASDIDMFQPYDDFLIAVLMQLEQIGFCERGKGGKFLMDTDVSYRGSFPINSGGGQISAGQPATCGSGLMVTEALRQLFGDGGERQVNKARTAMCTGIGIIRHYHNWGTSNVMIMEAGHA